MRFLTWPFLLGFFALILWISYALLALSIGSTAWTPEFLRLPTEQGVSVLASRGQFGDAFGAFNALVSTFALIGLFFTINSQQNQLSEQSKATATSERLTRQQQFQELFYRAVDTYRQLLSEVSSDSSDSEDQQYGRVALWKIWREQFVSSLGSDEGTAFDSALKRQLEAYKYEHLGDWNSNADRAKAILSLSETLKTDPTLVASARSRLGKAWASIYSVHRYQLDSLFRAWYTAYRVLSTAPLYGLETETARLYSATFRAQLSWIEMAFLLVNQSGLPENMRFPKACNFSNEYATFDNLDLDSDAIVATLAFVACDTDSSSREPSSLTAAAFGNAKKV